jgi:DNA-directed RNA polymerase specialized sigma24 family protein
LWLSFINKWNIKNTFNIIKKQDLDDILQTAYLKFLKKPVYYNDDINTQYFKKVLKSVYIDTYRRRKNNKYVSLEKSLKHLDKLFYYNDNRMIDWKGQTTRNKILFSFNGEKYTENTKKQEDRYKNVLLKIKKLNKEDSLFLDYAMENNINITKISKLLNINYYSVYRRYKSIINFLKSNSFGKTTIYETENNKDIDSEIKNKILKTSVIKNI